MAVTFTKEQQETIDARNASILVSAAAGSGKTAVLVERIIQMVKDPVHPVDIDRLLVVTFTSAAAAQMRERISQALSDAVDEHPENAHLTRQLTLIHHAQITTIDSFCLYLIRNHFDEIGLDPDFRVADEGEVRLLKRDVLDEMLEEQIAGGTDAIIICGTTGESATMTEAEHMEAIRFTVERVKHRIPVIAGTGSNCTATAVELSKEAEKDGADGLLLVTPYYNKATQNGLIAHYTAVCKEVKIPAILYNVPSRTGCNIQPATLAHLVKNVDNIVGVKEASGNIGQVAEIMHL